MLVVLMGVCGAGKTTVGRALARALPARFVDADEASPALDDDTDRLLDTYDRADRLDPLRPQPGSRHVVLAWAALRRRQRDALRARQQGVRLVYLHPSMATLVRRRLTPCTAHDLPAQLRTLEAPGSDEGAIFITNEDPVETVAARILSALVLEIERSGS